MLSDDLEFSSQKINQLPLAFSFDNGVSYQLCFLPLEIRRFSARNWPIMRWIVYGYLVIVMQ